ncbi:MAG: PDZ domain-containing protein [Pyrinomonadaceae bacterium]|nr:PDZ domain-containing protein [Pyrinomonadaceae bacterium]MBP6212334.1 PDZ domain-containing protein [Pyrinomonadaceae bacterium]
MFQRSFVFILTAACAVSVFGQTPEAKKEKEKAAQAMAWTFESGGGYLGVQTAEVTSENFAKFGLREVRGVAVERVLEDSPAQAAGLQPGDVIISVDGDEITGTRKLTRLIGEIAADHKTKLVISRNGSEQEITATIGKRPGPKFENGNFAFSFPGPVGKFEIPDLKELRQLKELPKGEMPQIWTSPDGNAESFIWRAGSGRQIGIGITPLTKQLADHFGVEGGIMVNSVREGSPAFKSGIKAGDIVVEADGKAVKGELDLIRTIGGKKEGDVQLTIVRDRNRQTISVTPEVSKTPGFVFKTEEGEAPFPPMPQKMRQVKPPTPPAATTLLSPGRVL